MAWTQVRGFAVASAIALVGVAALLAALTGVAHAEEECLRLALADTPPAVSVEIDPLVDAQGTGRVFKGTGTLHLEDGGALALKVTRKLRKKSGDWNFTVKTPGRKKPKLRLRFRTDADFATVLKLKLLYRVKGERRVKQNDPAAASTGPCAAPPVFDLDPTLPTDFVIATEFLYSGGGAVQTGMASGTIDPVRAAVLRGRVLDGDAAPVAGVRLTLLGHDEYGETTTQADGWFDMAVNGGGPMTVTYEKDGFLPLQRQTYVDWREFTLLPDVVLTELDTTATVIDLSSGAPAQVHRASVVTDVDGTRQATLIFPAGGNTATFRMPDGTTQPGGSSLTLRATEYTVGDTGPERMPGDLPPSSAYTYAVEFTADEAEAAGAVSVEFATPLVAYLDNFLGLSVDTPVPTGYFDRARGVWIPVDDGRVVKILDLVGGTATLDTTGDGAADNGVALGVTDGERQTLASIYTPGTQLWRVPLSHFSPHDLNFQAPPVAPAFPGQSVPKVEADEQVQYPQEGGGYGRLAFENQVLFEDVPVVGTPFALHYASDAAEGRAVSRTMVVSLSGAAPPPSLQSIEVEIEIAGRRFTESFAAQPNQTYQFTWDGEDAYGRTPQGEQPADVRLRYNYLAYYGTWRGAPTVSVVRTFGFPADTSTLVERRAPLSTEQRWTTRLGGLRKLETAVGGMGLTPHHVYDPYNQVLYHGDGTRRTVGEITGVIRRIAGQNEWEAGHPIVNGDRALDAYFLTPAGMAYAPDGSLFVADAGGRVLRRIDRTGLLTNIAGLGFGADGGPAADAALGRVTDMSFGPDGSLYLVDAGQSAIRRIGTDGIITRFAGDGTLRSGAPTGDGAPATQVPLGRIASVAATPDGSVYFTDSGTLRKVSPDGHVVTLATALDLGSLSLSGLAVGTDGSVYIATFNTSVLWRMHPGGDLEAVAGGGADAVGAIDGQFGFEIDFDEWLTDVDVGPDGTVFFSDRRRIYELTTEGIVRILVGPDGRDDPCDDAVPPEPISYGLARQRACLELNRLAVAPDGRIAFNQGTVDSVWRLESPLPNYDGSAYLIATEDASRVFAFDAGGRHLRTVHALTGETLFEFGYDASGHLVSVADGDGNVTTVERDGSARPTAIVAPFGQRTVLTTNAEGYIDSVTNPAGETTRLTYSAGGLLTAVEGAEGPTYLFTYDAVGRLIGAEAPDGGTTTLTRAEIAGGHQVVATSPEGRTTTYRVERLADVSGRRTVLHADGTTTVTVTGTDGGEQTTLPTGTVLENEPGEDPRFGMQAPFTRWSRFTTPGGLERVTTATRAVVLTDPLDLFSIDTSTETLAVNGRTSASVYDGSTRTWTLTSPEGRERYLGIDLLGRPTSVQVEGLAESKYVYDARGRLVEQTDGTGGGARVTTYTYDSAGWLARITDPLGRTVDFDRDLAWRPTSETRPDGRVIEFTYDAHGNLTSVTPPSGDAHGLDRDDRDQLATYAPPLVSSAGAPTTYTYDGDRQADTLAHSDGRSIKNGYDAAGRLATTTFSAGTVTMGYAAGTGLLSSMTAPAGDAAVGYGYDGGLLTSTTWSGPVSGSVGRTYDDDLRLATVSVNGSAVGYSYDDDDNVTAVGGLSLTHDATTGLLTGTSLGAATESYQYDGFGAVTRHTAMHGATTLLDLEYEYDALGRVTTLTETIEGATRTIEYGYDTAGRLETVDVDSVRQVTYAYDRNGNRTSAVSGGTVNGTYDARDRVTAYGSGAHAYRESGELTTKTVAANVTSYAYDERDSLRGVTLPGGTQVGYVIDALGRRVGKSVGGTPTQGFLYGDALNPVAELDGADDVVSVFDYASRGNVPDTMVKGGTTYRILSDHLGSPRLVVDVATGAVAQRLDYDAFGVVTADTSPGFQPFGFAGGHYDADTGLVRFGARDYDPATGRFTARDPTLFGGGQGNLYVYAGNDPVNLTDPSGLGAGAPLLERDPVARVADLQGAAFVYRESARGPILQRLSIGDSIYIGDSILTDVGPPSNDWVIVDFVLGGRFIVAGDGEMQVVGERQVTDVHPRVTDRTRLLLKQSEPLQIRATGNGSIKG